MIGDSVHHNPKGQDMAPHDEDEKQELTQTEEFSAKRSQQDLSRVPKILDVRVSLSKQPNIVSGVGRKKAKTDNQDDSSGGMSVTNNHTSAIEHLRDKTQSSHSSWKG